MKEILIISRWPDIPGHGGGTETASGYKRAESADGRWWLVREKGIIGWLRGWDWLPVSGAFVSMQPTTEKGRCKHPEDCLECLCLDAKEAP